MCQRGTPRVDGTAGVCAIGGRSGALRNNGSPISGHSVGPGQRDNFSADSRASDGLCQWSADVWGDRLSGAVRLLSPFGGEGQSQNRCSRGQTPIDYLIGISLVLVTILGMFVFVPVVFDPFEPAVGPDTESMADQLADNLVTNHSYVGEERTLNRTAMEGSLENELDVIKADAGITERERVNVTIQNGTGSEIFAAGDSFPTGAGGAATSARTFVTRDQACTNGCQLIVRVWTR